MNIDKWQDIKNMIKDKFTVDEEGKENLEDVPNGYMEFIIFLSPLGKVKLEYIVKPVILDKKTIGSRRIGSETTVEYIYSDNDFAHIFKAYKWDGDQWLELEKEKIGAFTA